MSKNIEGVTHVTCAKDAVSVANAIRGAVQSETSRLVGEHSNGNAVAEVSSITIKHVVPADDGLVIIYDAAITRRTPGW